MSSVRYGIVEREKECEAVRGGGRPKSQRATVSERDLGDVISAV